MLYYYYLIFFFKKRKITELPPKLPFLSSHTKLSRKALRNEKKIECKKIPNFDMIVTLNPKILYFSKTHLQSSLPRPSLYFYRARTVSLITNCKLQKPEDGDKVSRSSGSITKTISLSDSAPPVTEETHGEISGDRSGGNGGGGGKEGLGFLKRLPRKVLSILSNLPLAITEMFTIAALMALGKSFRVLNFTILD